MSTELQLSNTAQRMKRQLGDSDFDDLVRKAGGYDHCRCYLCEDRLELSSDQIETDHVVPNGDNAITNLYLAHRLCNELKRDLPVDAAKRMIKFRKLCEGRANNVSFDDVLGWYVNDPKRQTVNLSLDLTTNLATVHFGNETANAPIMEDPATNTRYFFIEVPVKFITNDRDVQPRKIDWRHAWLMAEDFERHPVHEPSSCRIDMDSNGLGKLLQFDGQHKTTAQIILNRQRVPMKVYIAPQVGMIRELILAIQNKIKKMPLQTSIAITKMADVYQDHWEESGATTESEFVKSYRSDRQAGAKQEIISGVYRAIIDDQQNEINNFVQKQRARSGSYPLSMNNLTNLILKTFVCQVPQTVEVGSPDDLRSDESRNVLLILNELTRRLLDNNKWEFERPRGSSRSPVHEKAARFFMPGSVRYWTYALKTAIDSTLQLKLLGSGETRKTLLRRLTPDQDKVIVKVIERLVEHPIWTDDTTPGIDGTLKENSFKASEKLFTDTYPSKLTPAYLIRLGG